MRVLGSRRSSSSAPSLPIDARGTAEVAARVCSRLVSADGWRLLKAHDLTATASSAFDAVSARLLQTLLDKGKDPLRVHTMDRAAEGVHHYLPTVVRCTTPQAPPRHRSPRRGSHGMNHTQVVPRRLLPSAVVGPMIQRAFSSFFAPRISHMDCIQGRTSELV